MARLTLGLSTFDPRALAAPRPQTPAPPASAPAWLSPRRVTLGALVLGALALSSAAIGPFGAAPAMLGALAIRPRPFGRVSPHAGLLPALAALTWPGDTDAGPRVAVALLLAALGPLALLVAAFEQKPTHDALDHVLLGAGSWLLLAAGTGAALAPPGPTPHVIACALAGLAGALAAGLALALSHHRVRWLGRVYEGADDRWQIVRAGPTPAPAETKPLFLASGEVDGLLCPRPSALARPYRLAPPTTPAALLPFDGGRALELARRRRSSVAALLVAQLALLALLWAPLVS